MEIKSNYQPRSSHVLSELPYASRLSNTYYEYYMKAFRQLKPESSWVDRFS